MSSLWPGVRLFIGSVAFYINASNSGLLSPTDSNSISYCLLMWLELNDSHGWPQKHGPKIDLNTVMATARGFPAAVINTEFPHSDINFVSISSILKDFNLFFSSSFFAKYQKQGSYFLELFLKIWFSFLWLFRITNKPPATGLFCKWKVLQWMMLLAGARPACFCSETR